MQKTWIILASCLCITGCFRTTTVIKGSVIDASMNTVTLQTQENKTYVFSTIETDKSQLNGLLLGKSVKANFSYLIREDKNFCLSVTILSLLIFLTKQLFLFQPILSNLFSIS